MKSEKTAVKKASDHSDIIKKTAPALRFTGTMSTDEVIKITLLIKYIWDYIYLVMRDHSLN